MKKFATKATVGALVTVSAIIGSSSTASALGAPYTVQCQGHYADGTAWDWEGTAETLSGAASMVEHCEDDQNGTDAVRIEFFGIVIQDSGFE